MGFAKQHAEQHPDQTPFRITCIEAHSTTCMKQQHTVLCGWHQSSSMPSRDLDASCRTVGHGSLCCAGVVCWGSHIWRHPAQQEDAGMAHHACGSGASHRAGHTAAASGMLSCSFAAKPVLTSETRLCQEETDSMCTLQHRLCLSLLAAGQSFQWCVCKAYEHRGWIRQVMACCCYCMVGPLSHSLLLAGGRQQWQFTIGCSL